jgi:hypothetical protein
MPANVGRAVVPIGIDQSDLQAALETRRVRFDSMTRHKVENGFAPLRKHSSFYFPLRDGQVATRRVRIVKYRGSAHGTSEHPALINERGLSVLPISSLGLI